MPNQFNMLNQTASRKPARIRAIPPDYSIPPTIEQVERISEWLSLAGCRVVRPLVIRDTYSRERPPKKLVTIAILDTETTGLDVTRDKVIELGMVLVEVCPKTGQAYRVVKTYSALEDPEFHIPDEATRVNKITDQMVSGLRFDDAEVEQIASSVSLVISHNAAFDRPFVEERFPFFANKPWACSFAQVPWAEEGIGGRKLQYLAYHYGFDYNGHRATTDCHALLEVLQKPLRLTGTLVMRSVLEKAFRTDVRVSVLEAPFAAKDVLKANGFRWLANRRVWCKSVDADMLPEESGWLAANVYSGQPFKLEQEEMTAMNRFSSRRGPLEIVSYA